MDWSLNINLELVESCKEELAANDELYYGVLSVLCRCKTYVDHRRILNQIFVEYVRLGIEPTPEDLRCVARLAIHYRGQIRKHKLSRELLPAVCDV